MHLADKIIGLNMHIDFEPLNIAYTGDERQHENQKQKNHAEQDEIILHLIAHGETGEHQKASVKAVTIGQDENMALPNMPNPACPFAPPQGETPRQTLGKGQSFCFLPIARGHGRAPPRARPLAAKYPVAKLCWPH